MTAQAIKNVEESQFVTFSDLLLLVSPHSNSSTESVSDNKLQYKTLSLKNTLDQLSLLYFLELNSSIPICCRSPDVLFISIRQYFS